MQRTTQLFGLALLLVVLALAGCTAEPVHSTELQFVTHLTAGMPEQDVYIVKQGLADGEVVRASLEELAEADVQAQMIYASAEGVEHDPFGVGEAPLGPFQKGDELGFTMAEWLTATGSGTYAMQGNDATLDLSFENLIPGGLYTMWCTRIKVPPEPVIFDIACGQWDGSNNWFVASDDGSASFSVSMQPMMDTDAEHVSLVALAYHSDGNTWGPLPGDFGSATHVQAVAFFPPPDDAAWKTSVMAPMP